MFSGKGNDVPRKRIPFIACEFPVFEAVQAMALAAKVDEAKLGWGLMKLWRRCWESKTEVIHEGMIDGYVPAGCLEVLILFGFAEQLPHRKVRLCGLADRYIRVKKSGGEKVTSGDDSGPSQVPLGTQSGTNEPLIGPLSGPKGAETDGKIEDRRSKTDQKDLSLGLEDDEPARKLSKWEELWQDMCEERTHRLEALRDAGLFQGSTAAEEVGPRELNALLSDLAAKIEDAAGEAFSDGPTEIAGAWRHFLIDEWARKLKPLPFALRPFVHPNNWRRCWEAYNQAAMVGGGA